MFIGKYYHRLESKGRVSLPVKFREALQFGAIATRGLDGCLVLFDEAGWKRKLTEIEGLSQTKKANRDYIRFTTNDAQEIEIDNQGRIRLDDSLRTQASLSKEVVFVGTLDHVEIWDKEMYAAYFESIKNTIEQQVEHIESES